MYTKNLPNKLAQQQALVWILLNKLVNRQINKILRGGFLGLVIRNTKVDVLGLLNSKAKRAVQAIKESIHICTVVLPNKSGKFMVKASGK